MNPFVPMTTIIPDGQESEHFRIEHYEVPKTQIISRHYVRPGRYVRLMRKHPHSESIVMSDTPSEQRSNYDVVYQAEGDVLIAGLGIGMVLVPILLNPKVTSVTVVEIGTELTDMVVPHLPNTEKLTVINADIHEWQPPKGSKWDVVYFDIWDNICSDNLEEMKTLSRRFGRRKRKWMGCWSREECLELRGRGW